MQCPHLSESRIKFCTLNDYVYIPSLREVEQYCSASGFIACPVLQNLPRESAGTSNADSLFKRHFR